MDSVYKVSDGDHLLGFYTNRKGILVTRLASGQYQLDFGIDGVKPLLVEEALFEKGLMPLATVLSEEEAKAWREKGFLPVFNPPYFDAVTTISEGH